MTRAALALTGWTFALVALVAVATFAAGDLVAGSIALATLAVIAREVWTARNRTEA